MDRYDVIVIGTGAGGGSLARHLAPSGKRILLLERGGWLPRELENWLTESVFVDNRYVSQDTWYDRDGTAFQPGVHYYVGGVTKLYGAALYRLREEDFGELRHTTGSHLPGPSRTTSSSRTTRSPSSATRCTAHGARIRPSLRRALRTHTRRCRTTGSSSSRTISQPPATSPSTRPAGSCSTSRIRPSRRASAVPTATASRVSSTRSRTRRCSACGPHSSIRT